MGKQWKQWQTLSLGGSKIAADGDCSHEVKRYLLLGRKVMTNLDSILKEKAMAPHSSTLAWKIPWMEEPGRLQSMAAVTICSDFGTPKIKSATVSIVSPSISHEVMGLDAMIFVF